MTTSICVHHTITKYLCDLILRLLNLYNRFTTISFCVYFTVTRNLLWPYWVFNTCTTDLMQIHSTIVPRKESSWLNWIVLRWCKGLFGTKYFHWKKNSTFQRICHCLCLLVCRKSTVEFYSLPTILEEFHRNENIHSELMEIFLCGSARATRERIRQKTRQKSRWK